jgi:hypothetical protein
MGKNRLHAGLMAGGAAIGEESRNGGMCLGLGMTHEPIL